MKDNYRAGNYRIGLSRVIPSSRKKERKIILTGQLEPKPTVSWYHTLQSN